MVAVMERFALTDATADEEELVDEGGEITGR